MINFIQTGGVNWIFSTITGQLMRHMPGESITTPLPMMGADTFVAVCPEYTLGLLPEQRARTWSMLHHFETNDPARTPQARAKLLDGLAGVVVFSESIRRQALAAGIKAKLLPHGVDLERFTIQLRAVAPDALRVGVCGRNHESGRKGPQRIIEIARVLGATMGGPRVVFAFCGHEWDPVIGAINTLGGITAERWIGSGKYETYAKFYAGLDVLLCASDIEGGPYPPLEALACGVPVVSTPVGHMPELVARGSRNVTLFGYGDIVAAANAILVLHRSPPDRALLRASVADRSWEAVARKWAALLGT